MTINISQKRLTVSFAASLAAHLLLVLLIVLVSTDKPIPKKKAPQIMDVVLLDPKKTSKTPPKDAKTISNRSAEGGSSKAKDRRTRSAKAPVTGPQQKKRPSPNAPAMPKQAQMPPPKSNQRTRTLAKRDLKNAASQPPEAVKKPTKRVAKKTLKNIPRSSLYPSSMAMADLSRQFERERRMEQYLKREADVPINTREAKFAPYMQAMVRSLEEQWRPGGQTEFHKFSADARRVLMRITVESSGELSNVEILQPSPIPALNESAIAAIYAASPFRRLPRSWGLDRIHIPLIFEVFQDRHVFRTM